MILEYDAYVSYLVHSFLLNDNIHIYRTNLRDRAQLIDDVNKVGEISSDYMRLAAATAPAELAAGISIVENDYAAADKMLDTAQLSPFRSRPERRSDPGH